MINRIPRRLALLLMFLAGTVTTATASEFDRNDEAAIPAEAFLDAMGQVRANLEDDVPRSLSRREWRNFNRIHDRMSSILDPVEDARKLPDRQRAELHDLQVEFNELMMDGVRGQTVCAKQQQVGSRIGRRNCRSVSEVEQDRRQVQDWLDKFPFQIEQPHG